MRLAGLDVASWRELPSSPAFALLRHLARVAIERDCGRMEWSVLNWNEPAIGFYKKIGARPMDEWTVYRLVGEDLRKLATSP